MKLKFATGGFPLTTKDRNATNALKRIKELYLDAMELEFVYNVFLKENEAEKLRNFKEELDLDLSVHASYFINLASKDKAKLDAGIDRLLKAARIGNLAGARYVTFHPAFRQNRPEEEVKKLVYDSIKRVLDQFDKDKLDIKLTPELTGKASQWGDLEELIELVDTIKHPNLGFCFDFAHKHARDGGGFNTKDEFQYMLDRIKKTLGQKFLQDMHIHISGINYSKKGERNHLTLLGDYKEYEGVVDMPEIKPFFKDFKNQNKIGPADLEWQDLLYTLKEFEVGGIVVCESPNIEQDALLMKSKYQSF